MPTDLPADPLPKDPDERAKVLDIARRAWATFNDEPITDLEIETILKRSWLEWEPKIRHVLAKTGQLEF